MSHHRRRLFAIALVVGLGGLASSLATIQGRENKSHTDEPRKTNRPLIRRSYVVAELIEETNQSLSPDNLLRVIVHAVKPSSWKDKGGRATIEYIAEKNMLVVRQTPAAHRQIASVLEALTMFCENSPERTSLDSRESKSKEPAELKRLADHDAKKEVKVVLWTYLSFDPREEFIGADLNLADKLAEEIRRLSEENKENVTVVKPSLVKQYRNRHDNRKEMDLEKIDRDFNADYVIFLDIDKLNLYELNSNQQLYRGQTEILVNVLDRKHPDDSVHKLFTDRYSDEETHLDTLDLSPSAFREIFFKHIAQRLAFYFVDHPKRTRKVMMDD